MLVETLSTFPDMFSSVMGTSMMRLAQEKGYLQFNAYDLREWTYDRHHKTDDEPYGGGHGLVMKCEPIFEAYEDIASRNPEKPHVIFLSPTGAQFDDEAATRLSQHDRLLFICGHYEGIDERAYTLADETFSLGDFVLTSGELASMVIIDAVVRKIPGVLHAELGAIDESFSGSLLEYPQYTRPAVFRDMPVPDVLLSGNHGAIAKWRRRESVIRTAQLRPDLLDDAELTAEEKVLVQSLLEKAAE